ncbi:MAG: hypothetical protein IPH80_09070 [Myxococcales bacterium]|nr:hypothetical protein [Myxococcales bacterium]MBP6849734.1 hypothetical protein [Kofleriaceae bacterium]
MERLSLALPLLVAACGQIVATTADAPEGVSDAARSPDGGAALDAPAAPTPDASPAPVDAASGYVLTVVLDGAGAGDVKSVPDGIACGLRCAEAFPPNTAVALTATPHAGAYFAGWNEPGCGMATTCTVVIAAPRDILAKFEVAP